MKFIPHPYQEEAIGFLLQNGSGGLFLYPGMGKTSISLCVVDILKKQDMLEAVLVIAPLRPVYTVWPNEIAKWDELKHLRVSILHGANKAQALRTPADVYIINPEGLKWLVDELALIKEWPFQMLIVDESTRFKHTNTQRFKLLRPMLNKFTRRVILTGSPAANGLLDLFGQVYVMDRGATFGPYITKYKDRYFYQTGYGGYEWRLRPGADKEIYDALAPRVLRMSDKDYLKLPPLTINDVFLDMSPDVRKVYDQMENALRLEFDSGKVTAANTGVALMKCRQIASGFVYKNDGTTEHIHDIKTEAVEEILEELSGQPTIVAYQFEEELQTLFNTLGKDTPSTKATGHKWQLIEKAWNAGEVPTLLGQIHSLSHGLNLQDGGRAMILRTPDYNFEDYDQLIRRLRRQGQKKRVILHRLIIRNTVEEAVIASLKLKEKGQNALFTALKNYWKDKDDIRPKTRKPSR